MPRKGTQPCADRGLSHDRRPGPAVTLLDGFSLQLGRSQPRLLLDDVPHGVQRLVALALRGVRPSEHTTRPVRGIGRLHPATR